MDLDGDASDELQVPKPKQRRYDDGIDLRIMGSENPISFVAGVEKNDDAGTEASGEKGRSVLISNEEEAERLTREEFRRLIGQHENDSKEHEKPLADVPKLLDETKEREYQRFSGRGGFALKFLKKRGFTGRLGKEKDGISAPIQVASRLNERAGLGSGGAEVTTELNERVNVELFGDASAKRKLEEQDEEQAMDRLAHKALWKVYDYVNDEKKSQKKYMRKAASEIIAEKRKENLTGFSVFDLGSKKIMSTGDSSYSTDVGEDVNNNAQHNEEEQLECTSYVEILEKRFYRKEKPRIFGAMLLDQFEALSASAEKNLGSLAMDQKRLEDTIFREETRSANFVSESKILKEEIDELGELSKLLAEVFHGCEPETDLLLASKICFRILEEIWQGLPGVGIFRNQEDLCAVYVVRSLVQKFSLFNLNFNTERQNWEFLQELSTSWVPFLLEYAQVSVPMIDKIMECLLEKLETEISLAWRSVEDSIDCQVQARLRMQVDNFYIDLIDNLKGIVSEERLLETLREAVLPELQRRVDTWEFGKDAWGTRLDIWILPWVHHLRRIIRVSLHRDIRYKLITTFKRKLKSAKDHLRWGVPLLEPWREILSSSSFGRVMTDGVLPQLESILRRTEDEDFQQSGQLVIFVMQYVPYLRCDELCAFFESAFFPRFVSVLQRYFLKGDECLRSRIFKWYQGWKQALEPLLCLHDPVIEAWLGIALSVIASSIGLRQYQMSELIEFQLNNNAQSFREVLDRRHRELHGNDITPKGEARTSSAKFYPEDMPTREFLKILAPRMGKIFIRDPRGRMNHHGEPVYRWSSVDLYIHADVCYIASDKVEGAWKPITLESLVSM